MCAFNFELSHFGRRTLFFTFFLSNHRILLVIEISSFHPFLLQSSKYFTLVLHFRFQFEPIDEKNSPRNTLICSQNDSLAFQTEPLQMVDFVLPQNNRQKHSNDTLNDLINDLHDYFFFSSNCIIISTAAMVLQLFELCNRKFERFN